MVTLGTIRAGSRGVVDLRSSVTDPTIRPRTSSGSACFGFPVSGLTVRSLKDSPGGHQVGFRRLEDGAAVATCQRRPAGPEVCSVVVFFVLGDGAQLVDLLLDPAGVVPDLE